MKRVWLVLVAVWKIITWWAKRDAEKQARRKELRSELKNAKDRRTLDRLMSKL